MHPLIGSLLLAMAVAAAAWIAIVWRGISQRWLPADLRGAKLAMVERNVRIEMPFRLAGRPDRVYRLTTGVLVPVENKNRDDHLAYHTDIVQLSLQAWLLRRQGMRTASFGFVVINSRRTGRRLALRVALLDDRACLRVITRYFDVIEGRAAPVKSRGAKCRTCGHREICHG